MFARITFAGAALLVSLSAAAQWDVSGSLELETRIFPEEARFSDQDDATISPSVAFQPEFVYEWADGGNRLTLELFGRIDAHDERRVHTLQPWLEKQAARRSRRQQRP